MNNRNVCIFLSSGVWSVY